MTLHIAAPDTQKIQAEIQITGSKSETNRLLLLQALYPNLEITNLSNSDDAEVMQLGLNKSTGVVDVHHAGTAMRFLTAYFATQPGKAVVLTGSKRMKERPIKVLVDALAQLGASISYEAEEGYPPMQIKGRDATGSKVSLPANISSQYISALCMVAPTLKQGLELNLEGKITSVPYIKMTLALLDEIGVKTNFVGNTITVYPKEAVQPKTIVVESDWSAASYFYSVVAMAQVGSEVVLGAYKSNSLQGDSVLSEIYTQFGVTTVFGAHTIKLKKENQPKLSTITLDLANAPDIAQTIAVTCFGMGFGCHLTGLHTLPIKETDRLLAMKTELEKFGAEVAIDHESLTLQPSNAQPLSDVAVDTYHDHRMAMAFAPLAMKIDFQVNDAGVVSKSYPDFWKDFEKLGFHIHTTME
ncbi:MAG: 3-phosphoshikimate 1-carboxyvinyltransferase [Bacteroidota bacterium]